MGDRVSAVFHRSALGLARLHMGSPSLHNAISRLGVAPESLLAALERSSPVGIAVSDASGLQTYVSPRFCAMVGWGADELVGAREPYVYWPPEEADAIREALALSRSGRGPPEGVAARFARRSGERFGVRLLVAPLEDAAGGAAGHLATVLEVPEDEVQGIAREAGADAPDASDASDASDARRDAGATAQRRAERAAEQNAALLALTEELAAATSLEHVAAAAVRRSVEALMARSGALFLEEEGELRLAASVGLSASGERALARVPLRAGVPLADAYLETRPLWVGSPEIYAALYPALHLAEGAPAPLHFDASVAGFACVPLVREDKAFGVLALTVPEPRCFGDEERAFLTVLSRASAQTLERLRLLEEARETTERLGETRWTLEAVIASSPAAIVLIDADTTVRLWNPGAERLFGWRPDEVIGRPLPIVPDDARHEFERNMGEVDRGAPFSGVEVKRKTRSGALVDVAVWSAPIRRAAGGTQYLAVLADVSARRRADEEREEARRALQDAYAAVKAAEQRKDEFLAMLGHELRNPLAPIVTALELMRLRGDASFPRERAVIDRQVRHLTRLVDDLLDVSRITRGKITLRQEPLELAAVLTRAVEITSPLFERKRQRLAVDLPRAGLRVLADEVRLTQVFSNLLANAAKYTPEGGRIDVVARREGEWAHVRVEDEGRGIDPALLPRVFEPFVQGKQAVDRAEGGLGLGLAIVRSLVELHGGSVSASSPGPAGGSVFVVRLGALGEKTAQAAPRSLAGRRRRASRRVLVVDDNEDAADLLAELLRAQGYEVEAANDPLAALALIERFPAEVAIVDLGLPVMDGYELAAKLREHRGEGIRLLAVTGYGQDRDRARSAAAGFERHFVKPVDIDALSEAVAGAPAAPAGSVDAPGPG